MGEIKLAIVGASGCGKSALTMRYLRNYFITDYDPTVEDGYYSHLEKNGKIFNVEIIDTAGDEKLRRTRDLAIKRAQVYMIVYSVNSIESLQVAYRIYHKILNIKGHNSSGPKFEAILVGNKTDLSQEHWISKAKGERLAALLKMHFIEASAKTNFHVKEAFELILSVAACKRLSAENNQPINRQSPNRCTIC